MVTIQKTCQKNGCKKILNFEVVGNVTTPQPLLEPTPKRAPRPSETLEARVAVGESSVVSGV